LKTYKPAGPEKSGRFLKGAKETTKTKGDENISKICYGANFFTHGL
jgi:hypothetical protein